MSIAVETLQSGRSVSHVTARLTQRTGSSATGSTRATIALVSAALAAPRSLVADLQTVSPPAGPAPETLRPVNFGAFGPRFVSHFDVRFTSGAPLFSRSPAPRFGAWVRLHDAPPADMALRLALLDVLPPAIFAALPAPRPVATVTLTAHLLNTTTVPGRDAWWHVDSEVIQQVDGYSTQENRLYDAQGTLLGRGLQVVAVVK